MAKAIPTTLLLLLLLSSSSHRYGYGQQLGKDDNGEELRTFIVHVSHSMKPPIFPTLHHWYASLLSSAMASSFHPAQIDFPHTYTHVLHGFSVALTTSQASALSQLPGVLSATLDSSLELQTTRTPEFLGLRPPPVPRAAIYDPPSNLWSLSNQGDDVIVGVIDSGIWPERLSFDDAGIGPVPLRWKGTCEPASFCNRKIVGARAFYKGYESNKGPINETLEFKSPRDEGGHGTHTASTVAGRFVHNASIFGFGSGIATGIAPNARLAIYKACWATSCYYSDILAAFDAAVGDGVDIISLSVSGGLKHYYDDYIAIGTFGAMEKGILTCASAGNNGPFSFSISNTAPWILTVAASTLDRNFVATVTLGNGSTYQGSSLFSGGTSTVAGQQLPLVYARDAAIPGGNKTNASYCIRDTLDPNLVAGRIVVCDPDLLSAPVQAEAVRLAGGAATIIANGQPFGQTLLGASFTSPAAVVGYQAGLAMKEYIASVSKPTAVMAFPGTVVGVKPAPTMAAFSSRGPNPIVAEILKPDITAPGVNILAAWTGNTGPTDVPGDNRTVDFNVISGTSMSCPHVAGLAALLKGIQPDWSASTLKSALMTTSSLVDNTGGPLLDDAFGDNQPSNPFIHGSGHVVPSAATEPGLVYDIGVQDYIDYLCSLNYSATQLQLFTKGQYQCSNGSDNFNLRPGDLNYPSFSLVYYAQSSPTFNATYSRTLLNVGAGNSTYTVDVSAPYGVKVKVEPTTLHFSQLREKLMYNVSFEASQISNDLLPAASYGSLEWKDGVHVVKSPITFLWENSL